MKRPGCALGLCSIAVGVLCLTLSDRPAHAEMYVAGQVGVNIPYSLSNVEWGAGGRSGPIRLTSSPSFLSGVSADSHAASLPVGSITVYASSGVCLSRLECGLD